LILLQMRFFLKMKVSSISRNMRRSWIDKRNMAAVASSIPSKPYWFFSQIDYTCSIKVDLVSTVCRLLLPRKCLMHTKYTYDDMK
jgi:hypothetical protein